MDDPFDASYQKIESNYSTYHFSKAIWWCSKGKLIKDNRVRTKEIMFEGDILDIINWFSRKSDYNLILA